MHCGGVLPPLAIWTTGTKSPSDVRADGARLAFLAPEPRQFSIDSKASPAREGIGVLRLAAGKNPGDREPRWRRPTPARSREAW